MKALGTVASVLFVTSLVIAVHAEAPSTWLVIGPKNLQDSIQALSDYRAQEGFAIEKREPPIRKALQSLKQPPAYILLLGDDTLAAPLAEGQLQGDRKTLYRWQATQPETYVSDTVFGDWDGDGIPEIPVGRLPGRSPAALARLATKIVAFEKAPTTEEALHIPVWAGNPAYGDTFHANMASNLLRQTLHREAPPWADLSVIMGNATDPLSGHPELQSSIFESHLARGGGLFTGLMGHGSVTGFYSMPYQGRWITYQSAQTTTYQHAKPSAPMVIFACDCGNFAHPQESLSEAFLHAPGGPVAVIAATTQSHPLPNYYSSVAWLQSVDEGSSRLGDRWTETQREGHAMKDLLVEMFLKDVEGKLEAELNTPKIRQDHLFLYALLGDPATKLKRPYPLKATFTREGDRWTWSIPNPPVDATRLTVGHRVPPPPLKQRPALLDREAAMALFADSQKALRFTQRETRAPIHSWKGEAEAARGTLRITVVTPNSVYVATQDLSAAK